jgi:hypothetical protein
MLPGSQHESWEEGGVMKFTTLEIETQRMCKVLNEKLLGYKAPKGSSVDDVIFKIFKSQSRTDIDPDEQAKMMRAIVSARKEGRPINVSFLWALGGISRSTMKFFDSHLNLPRLGDFWAFFWLEMLNRKIRTIFPLGCKFVIIDEVPIIKLIPEWDQEKIDLRKKAFASALQQFPNIRIRDLPDFVGHRPVGMLKAPENAEVLAVLTSRSELENVLGTDKMELIYRDYAISRQRDWETIKGLVPCNLWEHAIQIRREADRIQLARKETNWVKREVFCGQEYIDGALTEKGRWCPSIWPETSTSPQHGGSVVKAQEGGKFSVAIVPEYRLIDTHQPVYVSTHDLEVSTKSSENMVFYWERKGESW